MYAEVRLDSCPRWLIQSWIEPLILRQDTKANDTCLERNSRVWLGRWQAEYCNGGWLGVVPPKKRGPNFLRGGHFYFDLFFIWAPFVLNSRTSITTLLSSLSHLGFVQIKKNYYFDGWLENNCHYLQGCCWRENTIKIFHIRGLRKPFSNNFLQNSVATFDYRHRRRPIWHFQNHVTFFVIRGQRILHFVPKALPSFPLTLLPRYDPFPHSNMMDIFYKKKSQDIVHLKCPFKCTFVFTSIMISFIAGKPYCCCADYLRTDGRKRDILAPLFTWHW